MSDAISRLQILIVDDSAYMRGVLRAVLRAIGVEQIYEAGSAPEAMQVMRERTVDIVFVDWMMQPLSGLELVRYLRNSEFSPNQYVPIIMVTGHTEPKNIMAARDLGITEFLAKPITAKTLYERIIAVVTRPRPFIRAKEYFGPDRRRKTKSYAGGDKRREG